MATINFLKSEFSIKGPPALRDKPEIEFQHRLNNRAHLKYLQDEKLFDVHDSRWAKSTVDGEVCYGHEYEGGLFTIRLKTADGMLNLTHNENGAFDRHLLDNPNENTVYSLTSSNNGLVSSQIFSIQSAGLGSIPIICCALAMIVALGNALAAAQAAVEAGAAVATVFGIETTVFPGVGLVLAILGLIAIWIVARMGTEIMLNLIYENRSKKSIKLVDHYVYNIGDNPLKAPVVLPPVNPVPPFEIYADVVVSIDNYSKFHGVGVSLKFEKEDGTSLIICIRNDIYERAYYTIHQYPKGDPTTAQNAYDNCGGDLVTADFSWGKDLIIKNGLNPEAFNNYNFSGIISFQDATA